MANLYYDVRVDIQKNTVIDSGIRLTQGDSKVIYLRIAVMNGGVTFDASNTTPSINFVKPNGTYVVGTPVQSGDFWIYQILGNELQSPGKVLCDVKFTYESGRVSSSKFTFIVEKDTTISGADASSSYIAPMEVLLSEMQNYKNQGYSLAESAQESAAMAKEEADRAAAVVGVDIATYDNAGLVKPDPETLEIGTDGLLKVIGGGGGSSDWSELNNKPFDTIGPDFKTKTVSDKKQLAIADSITTKLSKLDTEATATNGQALAWNGTKYVPTTIQGGSVPEGNEDWLKSKNLFDKNAKGHGIDPSHGNAVYTVLGVANDDSGIGEPLKAGTYTLSYKTTTSVSWAMYSKNENRKLFQGASGNITFTLNSDDIVSIWSYFPNNDANNISEIQLEEGSIATPYQPFNKSNAELTEIVEDSADWLKGKVLSYPTVTQGSITDSSALNRCSVNEFIAVEPNKNYIFTSNADVEFTVWYYENTTNDRTGASGWNGQNSFVTPSNCHYIKAMIRKAGDINIAPSDCGIVNFSVYYKSNVELTREISNSFSQAELIGSSSTMEGAVYFNNETLNKYKEIILEVKHEIISGENARRGTILIVPTAYINLLDISLGTTFGDIGIPNGVAAMIYLDKNIGVTYWYAKINKSGASQNFTFSVYGIK